MPGCNPDIVWLTFWEEWTVELEVAFPRELVDSHSNHQMVVEQLGSTKPLSRAEKLPTWSALSVRTIGASGRGGGHGLGQQETILSKTTHKKMTIKIISILIPNTS